MFVDLRGEFDIVTGHRRAGLRRVLHLRQQAVQRVPELVKQRRGVVPGNQNRLAFRTLMKLQLFETIGVTRLAVHIFLRR